MWKLRWIASVFFNKGVYKALKSNLNTPLLFYYTIVLKLLFDRNIKVNMKLKSGGVLPVYRFMDLYKFQQIFLENQYQYDLNTDKPLIVDVGANKGYYVIWADAYYNDASFICFEPIEENLFQLKEVLALNNIKARIYSLAFTEEVGKVTLHINPKNDGGHSLYKTFGGDISREVETVNLTWLAREVKDKINLLKLDCEGCEANVLGLLTPELAKDFPGIILETMPNVFNGKDLADFLVNIGYKVEHSPGVIKAKLV